MSRKVTLTLVAQPTRYGHRGLVPLSLDVWEQCFAFEMANEGVDIPAIDAFLANGPLEEEDPPALTPNGRKGWAPEGDTRRRLISDRQRSFEAYVRGDYSLAAALARGLRSACEYAGFRHVAEPLARAGKRHSRKQSSVASRPRPRKLNKGEYDEATVADVIADLVRDNPGETAKAIWARVPGKLEDRGVDVRVDETAPDGNYRKWRIYYDGSSMAFSTFERHVTRARNPQ